MNQNKNLSSIKKRWESMVVDTPDHSLCLMQPNEKLHLSSVKRLVFQNLEILHLLAPKYTWMMQVLTKSERCSENRQN